MFDQFYLYYKENAYYESGCSPDLNYNDVEKKFKKNAIRSMVKGRSYVADPARAMTKDYSNEVLQMNVKEIFNLVNSENENATN